MQTLLILAGAVRVLPGSTGAPGRPQLQPGGLSMPDQGAVPDGQTLLLLGFVALLAFVGWRVGVRRQAYVLFATAICAWFVATLWPELLDGLQSAFPLLGALNEPIVFMAGVSTAYLSSKLVRSPIDRGLAAVQNLPGLLDRSMGGALGAATGYLTGQFVLPRILGPSSAAIGAMSTESQNAYGLVIWLVIAVLILFGVASLSGAKGAVE